MSTRRTYGEACGIARALDAVGERWGLMVVRELLLGPKRFTDIRSGLPGLSADVLSQRLRELEQAGIVRRRTLPPPVAAKVYELTPSGQALEPVLIALGRWGGANAAPPAEGVGMSLDSHIVSLSTLFSPELAGDFSATVQLRLADDRYVTTVADGHFEVERGETPAPDATIETDHRTLIDIAHGRRTFADALEAGEIAIEGDAAVAHRLLGLFPLPAPATA